MSMFKKPKRNFRLRESGDTDDIEEETTELVNAVKNASKKDKKVVKKPPSSQPVLSFDLDLNEGDDGEIFQVKKSSQSKKMRKLLDKERKKKKDPSKDNKDSTTSNGSELKSTITTEDDIVITVKNTLPSLVLNGREAETAVVEGVSSDEDESVGKHKFSKASSDVKMLLQRGQIPDAATIHAVRQRRQHVRDMADFIPISEENSREKENGGRLGNDDDCSDTEEDRVKMTVDTTSEDRMRVRATFDAAQQQHESGESSDKGEEEEWEQQQIRKGVTGAQIAAVQQESLYYHQYILGCPPPPVITMEAPAPPTIGNAFLQPPRASDPPTADSVLTKLKTRLGELREVERSHNSQLCQGRTEIGLLVEEAEAVRGSMPDLEDKFRFYQELRGYVTDLVECLDEKILVIEMLEERVVTAFSRRVQEGVGRRRQDVKDQALELPSNPLKSGVTNRDEAMIRRVAEREGRRIRRQRQREIKGLNLTHIDGMSSDDEQTEVQQIAINNSKEVIEKDAKLVFDDVVEDYSTLEGILTKFKSWREKDMHSYSEAYVSLCLPKILGPLIRLKILFWNPLLPGYTELEKSAWYKAALLYGMKPSETEEDLKKDPDVQLVPRIVDRVILPKLNQLVKEGWDPMSTSQTICLISLVTRLIQEYPTLTHNSKSVRLLMGSVVAKIQSALDDDVYIPLYSKLRLADSKVNCFFMRQCAVAVKLLGNIARWQGLLNDAILSELAIDSLLNRYLMMAVGATNPLQAANIIQMIGSVLPRIWISTKIPKLSIFLNQIRTISLQLSADKPLERDAMERMASIL